MLVRVTRTASALTARGLFYVALFLAVVIVHLALTGALRAEGWGASASLTASGAVVLGFVLIVINLADWLRDRLAERRELQRVTQRLPAGPCCVVWRSGEARDDADDGMPWEPVGPLRARYPGLARRLGVEGVAIVDFEIGSDGRAKSINCVDAWPSDVFYESAREALVIARFKPKRDEHMRFGASYKMPFVFRIAGASKLKDRGRRARTLRPTLHAAQQAMENLRSPS